MPWVVMTKGGRPDHDIRAIRSPNWSVACTWMMSNFAQHRALQEGEEDLPHADERNADHLHPLDHLFPRQGSRQVEQPVQRQHGDVVVLGLATREFGDIGLQASPGGGKLANHMQHLESRGYRRALVSQSSVTGNPSCIPAARFVAATIPSAIAELATDDCVPVRIRASSSHQAVGAMSIPDSTWRTRNSRRRHTSRTSRSWPRPPGSAPRPPRCAGPAGS